MNDDMTSITATTTTTTTTSATETSKVTIPSSTPGGASYPPAVECTTMAEVRTAIDDLDVQIVTLLGKRMRYIEAAAHIKPARDTVRDEWRKQDVISKAVATGKRGEVQFPEKVVRRVYEELVEGSIKHEMVQWDEERGTGLGGKE